MTYIKTDHGFMNLVDNLFFPCPQSSARKVFPLMATGTEREAMESLRQYLEKLTDPVSDERHEAMGPWAKVNSFISGSRSITSSGRKTFDSWLKADIEIMDKVCFGKRERKGNAMRKEGYAIKKGFFYIMHKYYIRDEIEIGKVHGDIITFANGDEIGIPGIGLDKRSGKWYVTLLGVGLLIERIDGTREDAIRKVLESVPKYCEEIRAYKEKDLSIWQGNERKIKEAEKADLEGRLECVPYKGCHSVYLLRPVKPAVDADSAGQGGA